MRSTIPAGAFRTATDAILVVDDQRLVVEANAPACALTGLPRAELTRRLLDELLPVASRHELDARWGRFLLSGHGHGRCRFVRPDGVGRSVTYVARSNTPFRGFHLSVARAKPHPDPRASGPRAVGRHPTPPRERVAIERGDDLVLGELWDVLDEVAEDPALIDALEGRRTGDDRSEVA